MRSFALLFLVTVFAFKYPYIGGRFGCYMVETFHNLFDFQCPQG
jgi:hypothetical protein